MLDKARTKYHIVTGSRSMCSRMKVDGDGKKSFRYIYIFIKLINTHIILC